MTQPGNDPGTQVGLGVLPKLGAVSAAGAYATGVLTINIYLHQLKITDFSLAKPKLVLTGILVLLTFLLLALLPMLVLWRMAKRSLWRGSRRMLPLLFFPLLALFVVSAYFCFREPGLGQVTLWYVWKIFSERTSRTKSLASVIIAIAVYVPTCVAAVSTFAATRLLKHARSQTSTPEMVPERIYPLLSLVRLP